MKYVLAIIALVNVTRAAQPPQGKLRLDGPNPSLRFTDEVSHQSCQFHVVEGSLRSTCLVDVVYSPPNPPPSPSPSLPPPSPLHEAGWYHGNYDDTCDVFSPSKMYNGRVSCPETCACYGLEATGAQFVCNLHGNRDTEGCNSAELEGKYGTANCDVRYVNGNKQSLVSHEDCAGGKMENCFRSSCNDGVTYHSIQCQCSMPA